MHTERNVYGLDLKKDHGAGWTKKKMQVPFSLKFGCAAKISPEEMLIVNLFPTNNLPGNVGKMAAIFNVANGSYTTVEPPFWADASVGQIRFSVGTCALQKWFNFAVQLNT